MLSLHFLERFNDMKNCNNTYYTTVIVDKNKDLIIGTASLIVEKKFIHDCALVILQFLTYISSQ